MTIVRSVTSVSKKSKVPVYKSPEETVQNLVEKRVRIRIRVRVQSFFFGLVRSPFWHTKTYPYSLGEIHLAMVSFENYSSASLF